MKNNVTFYVVIGFLVFIALTVVSFVYIEANSTQEKPSTSALNMVSGKPVQPGVAMSFPNDHGSHLEQGIEWWYLTANLTGENGETFGVQWTLFRTLMPMQATSSWWDNNLYFAHFAIQHGQSHKAFERFARAGQAIIKASPFVAQLDDWKLASMDNHFLPLSLNVSEGDYAVDLTLANSPMVLHGDNGYSQKTQSGHASYYFSYPFLDVSGTVVFEGNTYKVSGNAWYDREWSASLLDKDKLGWDWFSLVDDSDGKKTGLMLFCIRTQMQSYDNCSGTFINSNGMTTTFNNQQIELAVKAWTELDGRMYPNLWQIKVPNLAPILVESVTSDSRNQLTIPYWEGRVRLSGGMNGMGYAELTGY